MLLKVKGIGGQTVRKIMRTVTDVDKSVDSFSVLHNYKIPQNSNLNDKIWQKYRKETEVELLLAFLQGILVISYFDAEFPQTLLNLDKFPVIIYAKGNIKLLNDKKIAIVGTRSPTESGKKKAIEITKWFSKRNYVVVSGLAKGCDAYAHRYAQKTIAVVAHGLDQPIYPRQNKELAENILKKGGLIISTYPLGTEFSRYTLLERDEWQSGLSDGVIVIETGIKGGTRATIRFATKQSRPIAVVSYSKYSEDNRGNEVLINKKNLFALITDISLEIFLKKIREFN